MTDERPWDQQLAHGGFKAEALGGHVATACSKATAEEAVEHLGEILARPEVEYTFGEALPTYYVGDGPMPLGRCLVHGDLAVAAYNAPADVVKKWYGKDFPARVITATVAAHDEDSAYLRAVDVIDEAKAILWLVSGEWRGQRHRADTLLIDDGQIRSVTRGGEAFGHVHSTNALLFHPYTFVSDAAAKDPTERTDWERRVIAAARWHYQAGATTWPSAALTSSMTALESLLLPPGLTKGKGSRLAGVLRDLGAGAWGPSDAKFTTWFTGLYKHRNDATHAGTNYDEDLEVTRLLTITKVAIRWAAGHLDPFHPSAQDRPCATLDEALATHP